MEYYENTPEDDFSAADHAIAADFMPESGNVIADTRDGGERAWVRQDVHDAISRMRAALAGQAEQLGFEITDEQLQEWRPVGAQADQLHAGIRAERVRLQMLDGLASYVREDPRVEELRPNQQDVLVASHVFLETAPRVYGGTGKAGFVDSPTGTGKTAAFAHLAQALKSQEDPADPVRVLVLSPTNNILRQTIGRPDEAQGIEARGFARFTPDLDVGGYNSRQKDLDKDVVVMTNASFNQLVAQGRMPHFDSVIVDETHLGLGESISESLQEYGRDKVLWGFTATPDYHDEKQTRSLLQHEIYSLQLPEAIDAGLLAPVQAELREMSLKFDAADLPADPTERMMTIKLAYASARLENAMPDIKEAIGEGKGVIVRCPSGGDTFIAEAMARKLRSEKIGSDPDEPWQPARDIRAVALGGSKQTEQWQSFVINKFNQRQVDVITYVNLIGLGTDLPPGKLLVNLEPTASRVTMVQAVGRILRLEHDEAGQPVEAKVIDYAHPTKPHEQYTALDALQLKPGQARQAGPAGYRPRHEAVAFVEPDEILPRVSAVQTVGSVALEHGVKPDAVEPVTPEQTEPELPPDVPERLDFADACQYFDLRPRTLNAYMHQAGLQLGQELDAAGLAAMNRRYPQLFAPDVPAQGYMPIEELMRLTEFEGTVPEFLGRLGDSVAVGRYRDSDGQIKQFVTMNPPGRSGDETATTDTA